MSVAHDLPCYAEPDSDATIVWWLSYRETVRHVTTYNNDDFAMILLPDNSVAYCDPDALGRLNAMIYAEDIIGSFKSAIPGADNTLYPVKLVDVRKHAPEIQIYQIFATAENFTGIKLYERDLCLMQEETLEKLKKAAVIFAVDGYSIKLYDAYRPYRTTVFLSPFNSNPYYLASPTTGSKHNRGAAVDMTLVDINGIELEMPSPMHTLTAASHIEYAGMTEAARRNLDYMKAVMIACGFSVNKYEWWHYNDIDYKKYPVLDLDLGSIRVTSTTKKPSTTPPPVVNPNSSGYSPLAPTPSPEPTPTPEPSISPSASESAVPTASTELPTEDPDPGD